MAGSSTPGPTAALVWPAFGPAEVVRPRDLEDLQIARQQLFRRHLRYLHGWGIVCGLQVVADPTPGTPWRIRVCPGYGVGPCGDELIVSRAIPFDLTDGAAVHRAVAVGRHGVVIVGLRGVEKSHGTGLAPTGCCPTMARHPTRVAERIQVAVLDVQTELPRVAGDLCRGELPCPPCPDQCDLPLAFVRLPGSVSQPITDAAIAAIQ